MFKIKTSKRQINNLALSAITAAVLTACGGGGSCGNCTTPSGTGQLIFVAPSILPSLANKSGINYMGVYNPSDVTISGISYSMGQQVGSGNSITLDQTSAANCASIAAKSSCFLKFSVPESTIAGGTVVTASNSDGTEAATPLAIGVQQVPYTESANANGVGLYFYPKAQYTASGVPFILVTAVVQSPNVGTINTIELVDESGNVISGQVVTSNNSGPGTSPLQMGDVVEISLPIPQGVGITQNLKVRTSYQTLTTSALNSIADKLNLKNQSLKDSTNSNTGTTTYSLITQSNNINLQFTPNQVYLTQQNSIQYGYLYNIGDLTASQIQVSSSSPNVRVTAADEILNGQRVIRVTYELINTSVAPATNLVTVTAQNPSGQIQTSTGGTSQNVNPDVVPTPSPSPTPTPTPGPTPTPTPLPQLTVSTNPVAPVAGGACSSVSAAIPSAVSSPVTVTFTIDSPSALEYGFGSGPGDTPFSTTATCTITNPDTTCSTMDGGDLCAATGSDGAEFTVTGAASGYTSGSLPVTVAEAPPTPLYIFVTNGSWNGNLGGFAGADAKCNADTAKNSLAVPSGTTWKAMLDGNNATISGQVYKNISDQTIATATGGNLVGSANIQNAIGSSGYAWTGAGNSSACSNWSSNSSSLYAAYGDADAVNDDYWSDSEPDPCSTSGNKLYCVQQPPAPPCTSCGIFVTASFTAADGGANLPAVAATLGLGSFTNGFAAGDAICAYNATINSYPGTYKALIAGTNRQPGGSDWVIKASTSYVRASDGTTVIGTSTAGAQLPATLTNAINSSVITSALNGFAYDSNPWVVDATNGNCSDWTSATAGTRVTFGNPTQTNAYAEGLLAPVQAYLAGYSTMSSSPMLVGCNSVTSVLYCVQQ